MKQTAVGSVGWRCLACLALVFLLGGCSTLERKKPVIEWPGLARAGESASPPATSEQDTPGKDSEEKTERDPQIYRGTGRFVAPASDRVAAQSTEAGDITLNFQNADLKEVVTVVLGDLLQLNYVLDPAVQGAVTLQTTRPLRQEDLLPTLETLLRMHGFAAVKSDDGGYRVMPLAKAIRGQLSPQLGRSSAPIPSGYSLRVVPLSYISATEMAEILQPIAPDSSIVRVDVLRNLLILAGTGKEISYILDTIEVFDVDWVKGMSIGFFPLQNAPAAEVADKLRGILGAEASALKGSGPKSKPGASPLHGLFRISVVDSANGLLVVTPQPDYLETVGRWVERLDEIEVSGEGERDLFVYRVKSGEAVTLAELLNALVGGESATVGSRRPVSLAPGERASGLSDDGAFGDGALAAAPPLSAEPSRPSFSSESENENKPDSIRIVADDTRNSLLITATAREYRKIKKALVELDIPPLQVVIEATIIEVQLKGDLEYGLQWLFNTKHNDYTGSSSLDGTLDSDGTSGLRNAFPGFNFTVVQGVNDVRAVFSALAEDSLINVLSSPSVMVLDNATARIQVGDQVPIATQQQQTTLETANVVNTIQYRDTGIVLEVKPRVTPGGLVTMEVDQEVSDVSATQTSTLDSPTITTRRISSSVAVQDGQAVVLGGLIRERNTNASGGAPLLKDVPVLGWLFGQKSDSSRRTELVVILTPRVIVNPADVARVTADFRSRMQGLEGAF